MEMFVELKQTTQTQISSVPKTRCILPFWYKSKEAKFGLKYTKNPDQEARKKHNTENKIN